MYRPETDFIKTNIILEVPYKVWFTRLFLNLEGEERGLYAIDLIFELWNGPICPFAPKVQQDLSRPEGKLFKDIVEAYQTTPHEISSIWCNIEIPYRNFKKVSNKLVYCIEELSYTYEKTTEKIIEIDLHEYEEQDGK